MEVLLRLRPRWMAPGLQLALTRDSRPPSRVLLSQTLRLAVYRQSVRLGAKPLRLMTRVLFFFPFPFFQLNPYGHTPCVTSSLTRGWDCLLWICLAFVKCTLTDG
jgi:hypothetical protein